VQHPVGYGVRTGEGAGGGLCCPLQLESGGEHHWGGQRRRALADRPGNTRLLLATQNEARYLPAALRGSGSLSQPGMRGDGQLQVDLANFWFSPSAPLCSMAKREVQSRTKHVNSTSKINSVASVSANIWLQICWYEGLDIGCGWVRHQQHVFIMLNMYDIADKVCNFSNSASSIKN
jgi:hypothetical protein